MPCLAKATDHMLLRQGVVTIRGLEIHGGAVLKPLACFGIGPDGLEFSHDWSKTQTDIADEPPYQFCRDCGGVRRSPWKPD